MIWLRDTLVSMPGPDSASGDAVRARAADILRPAGALQHLDGLAAWVAEWQRTPAPAVTRPAALIFARLVRASAQAVVNADFILASRAAGASASRVLLRHVLPQCYAPLLAQGTITLGSAILFASGLSFLGLGVQPPDPEWGAMLSRGRELLRSSPLGAVAPGVAITMVVLSFSLVGDGLKDALDPRR